MLPSTKAPLWGVACSKPEWYALFPLGPSWHLLPFRDRHGVHKTRALSQQPWRQGTLQGVGPRVRWQSQRHWNICSGGLCRSGSKERGEPSSDPFSRERLWPLGTFSYCPSQLVPHSSSSFSMVKELKYPLHFSPQKRGGGQRGERLHLVLIFHLLWPWSLILSGQKCIFGIKAGMILPAILASLHGNLTPDQEVRGGGLGGRGGVSSPQLQSDKASVSLVQKVTQKLNQQTCDRIGLANLASLENCSVLA